MDVKDRATPPGSAVREPSRPLPLRRIVEILDAVIIEEGDRMDASLEMVGASDLMSDVLAHMQPGALLLTGLKNPQVVRTAEMADLVAVCFVRGKDPEPQTLALAQARGLPLVKTHLPMYEACGRLYMAGMKACF